MAIFLQPTLEKGSDMVQDFLCSTCEDRKLKETAEHYCEYCVKFYCQKCIDMHGQLFTNHSPYGRGDMKKWPVAKKVEDFLLKCDVHKEENIEMFCKDHSKLCCRNCAIINHRQCRTVMLLSDLVKNTSTDLKQVSVTVQTTLAELNELQYNLEASIRSVQISFDEQLHNIQETRKQIIAALNILETKTLTEMKDTMTKMQAPLKSDVNKCVTLRDKLTRLGDAIHDICYKGKQELTLIASIKCQEKVQLFEKYRKKNFVQVQFSITFQPNSEIVQYLSKLSGLGMITNSGQPLSVWANPNQVIRIGGKSEYDVRLRDDSNKESTCSIRDICVLSSGLVLLADDNNNNIKLLNQQYQVVSYCSVFGKPWGMSLITPSEVGVAVGSKVKFIKVNNSQLEKVRKLQFQHDCKGIAYHEGDMFVTSGTALYKYSLNGTLVSKLHEDKSDIFGSIAVVRCAVSRSGDRLYITNPFKSKLLTLAMDGSVLATFKRHAELNGVHLTHSGQVLVCGCDSNTIIQMDSLGRRVLATLASKSDGLQEPYSVCYNSNTDSIIVGLMNNIKILVFKVQ